MLGLLFFLFFFQQTQEIFLVDSSTKQPVSDVYALTESGRVLVSSNAGKITVAEKYTHLTLSHLNYKTEHVLAPFPNTIFLHAQATIGESILIIGQLEQQAKLESYHDISINQAVENQLRLIEGIDLIQRGAFGLEPVIRGLSDQRISVSIDGMRVYSACTDKMDPPTAYIETGNLSQIELNRTANSATESGSSYSGLHLKTQKARYLQKDVQFSSGARYPDSYRFFTASSNIGGENQALRFTVSNKTANDFTDGNARELPGSGYSKLNTSLNHRLLFNQIQVSTNLIYDDAWNVGFPVLLMDATRAKAFMIRQEWQVVEPSKCWHGFSGMYYYNKVVHKMDDYSRDVTSRNIMKNMYMPMEGTTETMGGNLNFSGLFHGNTNLNIELIQSEANGFMLMEPLDATIEPMYLDNLSQVFTREVKSGFHWQKLLIPTLQIRTDQSLSLNSIISTDANYRSYFEELYAKEVRKDLRVGLLSQASVHYQVNEPFTISYILAYGIRNPNHNERFSHYVYNYTDGFFYEGNPFLKNEQSLVQEINFQANFESLNVKLNPYYRTFNNYIAGIPAPKISSDFYSFMTYSTIGKAKLYGFDFRAIFWITKNLEFDNRISYTRATFDDLNENMPFISPLNGVSKVHFSWKSSSFITTFEWSAAQRNSAKTLSVEDESSAFLLIHSELLWSFPKLKTKLSLEVQNIFDSYVIRHTSIGNLPDRGRTFAFSIQVNL